MSENSQLSGKRVLVVDDDIAFGRAAVDALRAAGAIAFGPALTAFHAECLLGRRRVDLVLLDTSLYGQQPEDYALALEERSVPVILMGEAAASTPSKALSRFPLLSKPASGEALSGMVEHELALRQAARPLPPLAARPSHSTPLHRIARAVALTLQRTATQSP